MNRMKYNPLSGRFDVIEHTTEWYDTLSNLIARITDDGEFSNPSGASGSEAFGAGAVASGVNSVALGNSATATGNSGVAIGNGAVNNFDNSVVIGDSTTSINGVTSIAIGSNANAAGGSCVAIGNASLTGVNLGTAIGLGAESTGTISLSQGALSKAHGLFSCAIGAQAQALQTNTVAIGTFSVCNGTQSITIGAGSEVGATHTGCAAIGSSATTTASYQLIFGGSLASSGFNEGYINGVARASIRDFILNIAGGSGTDVAGSTLGFAGGRGTGTGAGGDLVFYTAPPTTTGSTLNPLVEVLRLDDTGSATFTGNMSAVNTDAHIADSTIHFTEASISHLNIQNIGTNSHAQIDTHIANTSNPHSVTAAQVGAPDIVTTTTDNAIVRFDGTLGQQQNSPLLLADDGTLMTGTNKFHVRTDVPDGASAVGFRLHQNTPMVTDGSKVLQIVNDTNEVFYIGRENGNNGVWAERFAAGAGTPIDAYSFFKVKDTMDVETATPNGTGAFDLDITLNMIGAIKRASAFNGKATVSGSAVLPFISGMTYEVNQQGTGSWGAAPAVWLSEPAVIASRFTSEVGSADLGGWVANIIASTPEFLGGKPTNTYIGFAANPVGGAVTIPNPYGVYIHPQTGTTEGAGIYIKAGSSHAGIVLHDDNAGGTIKFGAARDASMFYDGTDLVVDPDVVGTGSFRVDGNLKTTEGVIRKTTNQTATTLNLDATHHIVFVDASSNAITVNLPASASHTGREYIIKATDSTNTITIDANASELIEDALTQTLTVGESITIICDGSQWWVV